MYDFSISFYVHMYVRVYVCMYVCMEVCMYVGLCIYVCVVVVYKLKLHNTTLDFKIKQTCAEIILINKMDIYRSTPLPLYICMYVYIHVRTNTHYSKKNCRKLLRIVSFLFIIYQKCEYFISWLLIVLHKHFIFQSW